ncbi:MAG: hypothetical protein ACLPVY_26830 [Acidimicrobiia bacterium]
MRRRRDHLDLTYEDGLLTGVLAGERVELPIDVPLSAGTARGCYDDGPVTASWHIASNDNVSEQPVSLEATFIDQAVALSTTFMRDRWNPELVTATIVGNIGDDPVVVNIAPGDQTHTFCADGHIGTIRFAVIAAVDRERATVGGIVENQPVKLTATGSQYITPNTISIQGQWPGPASLGLIVITCLLYFL